MVKISQYVKPKRIFSPKPAHVSISHRRKIKRTGIFDLPPELIELIIKQLTPWNGRIFRASCKQAKAAYDGYTWHQLNRELFRCLKNLPQTMTSYTVLKAIKVATRMGRAVGVFPIFLDKLLPQLHRFTMSDVKEMLLKYFRSVDNLQRPMACPEKRFLWLLNLIELVQSCKNTVKVKWENRPCSTFHTIEYVIPGVWLAVWRDRRGLDFDYFDDKNTILAIMAEIFYATHMNAPLRKTACSYNHFLDSIFIFGHEVNDAEIEKRKSVGLQIRITISGGGAHEVTQILRKVLTENKFGKMPTQDFSATLNIDSKEALYWGCLPRVKYIL